MSHIFISYSHKDRRYVEKLEGKLIEEGFNVWIDHRIDYGSQWTETIERAIDNCDAYIVVMSEDAKKSEWVQREVIHAERRNKPFFPLLLSGEFWFSLGNIQFVNVTNGSLPPENFYRHLSSVTVHNKSKQTFVSPKRQESTKPKSKLIIGFLSGVVLLTIAVLGIVAILSSLDNQPSNLPVKATSPVQILAPTATTIIQNTDKPDPTHTPQVITSDISCPGALPTRVRVGITIEVTTNQTNPVPKLGIRPEPTLDSKKQFELLSGENMSVIGGPVCSDTSYFWYIDSNKGTGWVREGNPEFYFVDPLQ